MLQDFISAVPDEHDKWSEPESHMIITKGCKLVNEATHYEPEYRESCRDDIFLQAKTLHFSTSSSIVLKKMGFCLNA